MQAVVAALSSNLSLPIEFVSEGDWASREAALDNGDIQLGWICGLPYVWKADILSPSLELLAAPVLAATRYENRPVYYSDVIVLKDSNFKRFADLRGARWAFNERRSHSGYNITRYHLASLGESNSFFGKIVEAGSHQRAIKLLLKGEVDSSAIDSSVLETEVRNDPSLLNRIRIIEALGPSPIPPLVVHRNMARDMRERLREGLINLHSTELGKHALEMGAVKRFVAVQDSDYDPIREMEKQAKVLPAW
jgi:phosphonate transport system substrate-binding protein